jgi:putative membrane protein
MPRVTPITCALVTAMVALAPGAVAQQDSAWWLPKQARTLPNGSTTASAQDTTFIRQVIGGNFTEVALARLAESRAESSDVKDFAGKMITDHDAMNDQWSTLANNFRMRIIPTLDESGKNLTDRLGKLKGSEFDQAYMSEMIQEHEQALAVFQQIRTSASDPRIRDLAVSSATTVSQHLSLARDVGSRVGIATTAGRVGGVPYPVPAKPGNVRRPSGAAPNGANERNERNLPPLKAEDRRFVSNVLGDHLLHVRLARIAERNAQRSETRQFAQKIETEFTHWANRWENFADRRDANVTSRLEQQDRNKIERLRDAKEKNFDRAYTHIVAKHLETMLDDFRKERWDERPDPAGRVAQQEIPVLRDLLQQARTLERHADNNDKK